MWIYVPGGRIREDGGLGDAARYRLERAAVIFKSVADGRALESGEPYRGEAEVPYLIVSGNPTGRYRSDVTEAAALRKAAVAHFKISSESIFEDSIPNDSMGAPITAAHLYDLVPPEAKPKVVVVVTSPHHVRRMQVLFGHMFEGRCGVRVVSHGFTEPTEKLLAQERKKLAELSQRFLRTVKPGDVEAALQYLRTQHGHHAYYSRRLDFRHEDHFDSRREAHFNPLASRLDFRHEAHFNSLELRKLSAHLKPEAG